MALGQLKSAIKACKPLFAVLRPAVQAVRRWKKSAPRRMYAAQREQNWKIQSAKGLTSEQIGVPQKSFQDVFGYLQSTPNSGVEVDRLHEAYFPQLPALITDGSEPHWRFETRRNIEEQAHYVVNVPQGRVFGEAMTPILPGDAILLDESWEFDLKDIYEKDIFQRVHLGDPELIDGKVALLGTYGDDNYFHWMIHTLPRLDLLRRSCFGEGIDFFVVHETSKRFMKETLEILGIKESQLINIRERPHLKSRELLVPTTPSINGLVPQFACQFLKENIPAKDGFSVGERIYISRETAGFRKVLNEEEVVDFLRPFGFEKVVMDQYSVAEQAAIHKHAKVIVSPHGANLTNIAFCEPGTKLVEIFAPNFVPMCYWRMAFHAGLQYGYMLGEGENKNLELSHRNAMDDITVDTKRLTRVMSNMGISS